MSQVSSKPFSLSQNDKAWLSDSVQAEVALKLAKGKKCIAALLDCEERVISKDELLRVRFERLSTAEMQLTDCKTQKSTLQTEIVEWQSKIERRDNKIRKLKFKQTFMIAGFGAVTVGFGVALVYLLLEN